MILLGDCNPGSCPPVLFLSNRITRSNLVRFPNPLFDVGWDYTTPIGGEFFFLVLQHSQLLTKMASGVLIGFVHTSLSHMRHLTFVHSLVLSLAPHVHPPPESNFCLRQMFQLDCSWISHFQLSYFLHQKVTFVFTE